MPYLTPQGDEILTPEEQAARDAAMASVVTGAGGGNAPIPPPQTAPVPSELYGGPAPAAGSWNDPNIVTTYDPSQSSGMGIAPVAVTNASTGQTIPTSYAQDSIPSPSSTAQPQQTGGYEPLPTPTPSSPTINARASDYTALGLDPTEYLRREYGPSPSGQGGTGLDSDRTAPGWTPGPKHPTFVDPAKYTPINQAWGRQDDSRPVPPPSTPTSNWWDGLTDAAGNIIPGLVQWATPGLASGPANSARQAQDAVGSLVGAYRDTPVQQTAPAQLNQGLGLTQPDTGISWRDVLSPGDWIPEPQTYRDSSGREMLGMGDAMFLPDPMGGVGTAGFADDAARMVNSADDAARMANAADDAARMRTTASGEAIPEPPTGKPLAEPAPVVDTAGSTTGGPNAAPVSGSTVPSGAKPRSSRLPRLTRGKLAATGAGAVVAAGIANNVLQTGQPGSADQPPGGSTTAGTPAGNPDRYARESALLDSVTSAEWQRRKDEDPDYWYSITKPAVLEVNGVRQKAIASSVVPGHYMGYFDEAGNAHPIGGDVSTKDFLDLLVANAAEAPPGWPDNTNATSTATPDQSGGTSSSGSTSSGTPAKGTTLSDVAIPTPDSGGSSGSSGKSSGGSSGSRSSGGGSSRSKDYGSDGDGYDQEFTAEDFMEAADGDRKKARMMAQIANKRRRGKRKGTTASDTPSGFWDGFPFNRPPTPIREHVLTALQESMAKGRK